MSCYLLTNSNKPRCVTHSNIKSLRSHPFRNKKIKAHSTITAASSQAAPIDDTEIAVIAFGGNALLKRGEEMTIQNQRENAQTAAACIKNILIQYPNLKICITHGNGPQVGLLAQQDVKTGLDILDAESEGQIGYMLELALENHLPDKNIATLLTQVVVDLDDPAFLKPTKPIGPFFTKSEADILSKEKGWSMIQQQEKKEKEKEGKNESPRCWRRVVASPRPQRIIELNAIDVLLHNSSKDGTGHIVICCGGGGIPVSEDTQRKTRFGVEAVIDKDAVSALLAATLGAKYLVMLTDASAVFDPRLWPEKREVLPSPLRVSDAEKLSFAPGSMDPKIKAACEFVKGMKGGVAAIGCMEDLVEILQGKKGTLIVDD